jgi:hypothetical protein
MLTAKYDNAQFCFKLINDNIQYRHIVTNSYHVSVTFKLY